MEAEFEREVLDRLIKIEGKLDGYNNAKKSRPMRTKRNSSNQKRS